jgi:hypothetical protein
MGAQPIPSARHDVEPTINEAGEQSFAVDGTDSFAVPGPADGLPPDVGDEDAIARVAAMRRLLITLGAAAAVLLVIIIVGRTGDSGTSDRVVGAAEGSDFSLPSLFGDPSGRSGVDRDANDEDAATSTTYDDEFASPSYGTMSQNPEYEYDDTLPSYPETSNPYDDDTFSDYNVPYVPSRAPTRPSPRYTPPVIRPRTPAAPAAPAASDDDAAGPEETSPETDPTTTTSSTTTSTSTTSTTTTTTTTLPPAPASAWKAPTTALGVVCGDQVRLWADHGSLLAGVGTARVWRSTDGGATWAAVQLGGAPTAYADDPNDPASSWIATSAEVFHVAAGATTEVGDLPGVTSLSAGSGATPALVAVTGGQVQRYDQTTSQWTPTAPLPNGAVAGAVVVLDADSFLVGTDKGIARSDDSGGSFVLHGGAGVVGAPARSGTTTLSWLLADRSGVLRSTDTGATWNPVRATGIGTDATALADVPSLGLVTTGVDAPLVAWKDGATTWTPLPDQPAFRPDGIARAGSGAGTTVWTSTCGGIGQPAATETVLRLADPVP